MKLLDRLKALRDPPVGLWVTVLVFWAFAVTTATFLVLSGRDPRACLSAALIAALAYALCYPRRRP